MVIYEEAKYTSLYSHKRGTQGAKIHGTVRSPIYHDMVGMYNYCNTGISRIVPIEQCALYSP